MNIAIRADASVAIGAGHVMRCLTLATALRSRGARSLFVCREQEGHLCDTIEENGFSVCRLPVSKEPRTDDSPAHASWLGTDWLQDAEGTFAALRRCAATEMIIVDHYALDHRWERWMRERGTRIAVVDDLADRSHDCDLLIDQNCLPGQAARYAGLLPEDCTTLFGPAFVLMRTEFHAARSFPRSHGGAIVRVLVSFGSADAADYTSRVIRVIRELDWSDLHVDVVTGAANPRRAAIEALCIQDPRFSYHCQVTNIAELMAAADLAISAGGFTSYELAYMGVPSILVPLSFIQEQVSAELAARGVAISLGYTRTFPDAAFTSALQVLRDSPSRCLHMVRVGQELFDGFGAQRVAGVLLGDEP